MAENPPRPPQPEVNLDKLWNDALYRYEKKTGRPIKDLVNARNFKQALEGTNQASDKFGDERHPKDKKDKLIQAVESCLDWVEMGVGFIAGHATGTAAAPAKAIAGAVSFLIEAAHNLTKDLDLIAETFLDIGNAMQDTSLFEGLLPSDKLFHLRLMEVFASLLEFCAHTTELFKKYGRTRLYFLAMRGRNEKIKTNSATVKKAISEFRTTIPAANLALTVGIDRQVRDMPAAFIDAIKAAKLDPATLQFLRPKEDSFEMAKKKFPGNVAIKLQSDAQRELVKAQFVEGTYDWIEKDSAFKLWENARSTPFLYVHAPSGTGKTYFAYAVLQHLTRRSKFRPKVSLAYFFFEQGRQETQLLAGVVQHIIIQIAEQDAKFSELVVKTKNVKAGELKEPETLWSKYVESNFKRSSDQSRTVYIILDGLDQLDEFDIKALLKLFESLDCERHAIQILLTGDSERKEILALKPVQINLTEKTGEDIKKVVQHRIRSSKVLSGFAEQTQKAIIKFLSSDTGGIFSLVDLSLGRMEQADDEKTALDEMKRIPKGTEGLYTSMIKLITTKRSAQNLNSIKYFFMLIAFAKQPLTVQEINHLLYLEDALEDFDVQAEIAKKLKSMLYTVNKSPDEDSAELAGPVQPQTQPVNYEVDSHDVNLRRKLNEGKHDSVAFRQSALKEHLQRGNNDLIQNVVQTKVNIFARLCLILCDRNPVQADSRTVLQEYAVSNLLEHFTDFTDAEVDSSTGKQTSEVIESLARVMTNEHDAHLILEAASKEPWLPFELYDSFNVASKGRKSMRHLVLRWARKMVYHGNKGLSKKAQAWVKTVIQEPSKILEPLAVGHLQSWFNQVTIYEAAKPYKLAYRALCQTKHLKRDWAMVYAEAPNKKTAIAMLNIASKLCNKKTITAGARIAVAVLVNHEQGFNNSISEESEYALELYEKNLNPESSGAERFYSYLGIADYYENMQQWEKAGDAAQKALQEREIEKEALGSDLDNYSSTEAFRIRARSLASLGHYDEAIKTYELGLSQLEHSYRLVDFFEEILKILAERQDWLEIIKRVQTLPRKMRADWINDSYYLWSENAGTKYFLRQAAVMTRRTDYLVRLYEEVIDYYQSENLSSGAAQFLQCELALIYRRDIRTTKMAKKTLNDILGASVSGSRSGNTLQDVIQELVGILFEEYVYSNSARTKQLIIDELVKLLRELADSSILSKMMEAEALLTLAKMLKDSKNFKFAVLEAEKAFRYCMDDLEDAVSYNDRDAFRMLGKVLMFANLEAEAKIALSLQFSEIDKSNEGSIGRRRSVSSHADSDKEIDDTSDDESVRTASVAGGSVVSPVDRAVNGVNDGALGTHMEEAGQGQSTQVTIDEVVSLQTNGVRTSTPDEVTTKSGDENIPKLAIVTSNTAPDTPQVAPEGGELVLHTGEAVANVEEAILDEDLTDGYMYLSCGGPCKFKKFKAWTTGAPAWRCQDCYSVDLCQECYETQQAFNRGEGDGFWTKVCWGNHEYIKQPIEGWQGVKDGVIRGGGKSKPFKEWLADVKKRWTRALAEMGNEQVR